MDERLYIVTYDIHDERRWRQVFRIMKGFGEWVQLSVFQCRLTSRRKIELQAALTTAIHQREDHVLIFDLGPADRINPRVLALGHAGFQPLERTPIIV